MQVRISHKALFMFSMAALTVGVLLLGAFFSPFRAAFADTFATPSTYGAGTGPRGIMTADFNGDGHLDLAVANFGGNTITIYPGDGTGSFTSLAPIQTIAVGISPAYMAAGIFDESLSKPDIAVVNSNGATVSILHNNGSGTFTVSSTLTAGSSPDHVVTADFNTDGHLDLAVTNYSDNTVSIFLGDGTGAFAAAPTPTISVTGGPRGIATADLGNGHFDLVVALDTSGAVKVITGNGDGTFGAPTSYTLGTSMQQVAIADFGNGHKDIAAVAYNSGVAGSVWLLMGDGTGASTSFTPASPTNYALPNATTDIVVADFNSDGKQDIATTNFNSNNVSILLGVGVGTLGPVVNYAVGSGPYQLTVGDFDGILGPDLAVTNPGSNSFSVLLRSPVGTLDHFSFNTVSSSQISGTAFPVTITAKDVADTTITSFTGTVDFTEGGASTITPSLSNSFVAGILTQNVTSSNISSGQAITATDHAGSGKVGTSGTFNVAAVSVSNVTSSLADGTYGVGAVIPIQITFTGPVTVIGTPQLTLSTGTPATTVLNYATGSTTNTLTFNYTVASSNVSADLAYASTSALALNGGTIKDSVANAAILTLVTPGTAGSLSGNKAIVIDTVAPVLTETTPVTTPNSSATPSYSFTSSEAGTITYGGGCTSTTTNATLGVNTIVFSALANATYAACTIQVTDAASNASTLLHVTSFTVNVPVATSAPAIVVIRRNGGGGGGTINIVPIIPIIPVETTPVVPVITPTVPVTPIIPITPVVTTTPTAPASPSTVPTSAPASVPNSGPSKGTSSGSTGGGHFVTAIVPITKAPVVSTSVCAPRYKTDTLGVITEETKSSYCQTLLAFSSAASKIRNVVTSPNATIVTTTIATFGIVASSGAVIASTLFLNPVSFGELFLIPIRLWSLLMTALGLKKRRRPWGTVYDSVTKQPLDPAYVTLRSSEGEDISSTFTDLDGRFGFVVPKAGAYALIAKKTNYVFPSQYLVGRDHDELYRDLYFGEYFSVATAGDIVIRNIPMDPEHFDWNEYAKEKQHLMKFYSKRDKWMLRVADVFYWIGFAVAAIATLAAPRVYNVMILGLYVVLFFVRRSSVHSRPYGYVMDGTTKEPVPYAIVRVSQKETGVEMIHRITDIMGKYYCLLPNGAYNVRIDKKLPDGTYSTILASAAVTVTSGYLSERFMV
jgi:hypothetical protein